LRRWYFRSLLNFQTAMGLPIRHDRVASVFCGISNGMRSVGADHIARLVGHLDLAVAAEQAAVLHDDRVSPE
jgi:hypothetical protein